MDLQPHPNSRHRIACVSGRGEEEEQGHELKQVDGHDRPCASRGIEAAAFAEAARRYKCHVRVHKL